MAILKEIEVAPRACYLGWPQVQVINSWYRTSDPRQVAYYESTPDEALVFKEHEDGRTEIWNETRSGQAIYSSGIDVIILRRRAA